VNGKRDDSHRSSDGGVGFGVKIDKEGKNISEASYKRTSLMLNRF
jgi:hypothetical protein